MKKLTSLDLRMQPKSASIRHVGEEKRFKVEDNFVRPFLIAVRLFGDYRRQIRVSTSDSKLVEIQDGSLAKNSSNELNEQRTHPSRTNATDPSAFGFFGSGLTETSISFACFHAVFHKNQIHSLHSLPKNSLYQKFKLELPESGLIFALNCNLVPIGTA